MSLGLCKHAADNSNLCSVDWNNSKRGKADGSLHHSFSVRGELHPGKIVTLSLSKNINWISKGNTPSVKMSNVVCDVKPENKKIHTLLKWDSLFRVHQSYSIKCSDLISIHLSSVILIWIKFKLRQDLLLLVYMVCKEHHLGELKVTQGRGIKEFQNDQMFVYCIC